MLKLSSYVPQLAATGGVISEFVNPKYKCVWAGERAGARERGERGSGASGEAGERASGGEGWSEGAGEREGESGQQGGHSGVYGVAAQADIRVPRAL